MFRRAVRITDPISGDVFATDWILEYNTETAVYLEAKYTVDEMWIDMSSFLAYALLEYWGVIREPRDMLKHFGYPLIVSLEDQPDKFCLLRKPFRVQNKIGTMIQITTGIDEAAPVTYCETLEDWREVYNLWLEEKKNEQSS